MSDRGDASHAVAGGVEGRREGGDGELARRDRQYAASDSAKGPSGINRFDYWDRWRDGVVPFAVEIRALDIEALHFLV